MLCCMYGDLEWRRLLGAGSVILLLSLLLLRCSGGGEGSPDKGADAVQGKSGDWTPFP